MKKISTIRSNQKQMLFDGLEKANAFQHKSKCFFMWSTMLILCIVQNKSKKSKCFSGDLLSVSKKKKNQRKEKSPPYPLYKEKKIKRKETSYTRVCVRLVVKNKGRSC